MSSDFLSMAVYLTPLNPNERMERMYAAINKVHDEEWSKFYAMRGDDMPHSKKEIREYMKGLIDSFMNAIEGSQVGTMHIAGVPGQFVFTGGMSHGDDPTDAFDDLNIYEWPDKILFAGGIDQPIDMLEESLKDEHMPESLKAKIKEYIVARDV